MTPPAATPPVVTPPAMTPPPAKPPVPVAPVATPTPPVQPAPVTPPAIVEPVGESELRVYPQSISLTSAVDTQQIIVQFSEANGITRDVTQTAKYTIGTPDLIELKQGLVKPLKDGQLVIKVAFDKHAIDIPVTIKNSAVRPAISYNLDVMPIFMRASCNTGSCHGAARGKDGFMLSLFGYDPDGDHMRITREQLGRRINLASPAESLLIEKVDGSVQHTGGKRIEPNSYMHKTLVEWVANGCPKDPETIAHCTSIELSPPQAVLDGAGATQQMNVIGHYSDGTTRDITSMVMYQSTNDNSAKINELGVVTADKRGEAFIMARYDVHTVMAQMLVLPKGLEFKPSQEKPANYIDELVMDKLKKLRINPSPICADDVFIRRIYVDLIGEVPSESDVVKFLADTNPNKRAALIDELLLRKEFTEIWVSNWAEWLMMRSNANNQVSYKSVLLYYDWLSQNVGNNVPLDQMVQELLGSEGGTFSNPETNFYELERETLKTAENVAQVFMGMRIQCAQCHNHPFDRWTQNDYYHFAAFFSQIGRKNAEDVREKIVFNRAGGEVQHPVSKKNMEPIFLGGGKADVAGKDRREVLAKWLASPENPYFARNFANRIWAQYFGIGIIDPVDDVRVSNPASNPELLDAMSKKFTDSRYDFRALIRDICNSNTYQRSTERNETNLTDEKNFAHQNVRRIKAESLLDIICQVTNTQEKYQSLPRGARAVQIADGTTSNYFLTTFGRATRETVCSCEVRREPNLSQALHLLNGTTVNDKIFLGKTPQEFSKEKKSPEAAITSLYLRCLSRKPTDQEMEVLKLMFADAANYEQSVGDVFWAILNSKEFLFNH
jgi:hypothetical protein